MIYFYILWKHEASEAFGFLTFSEVKKLGQNWLI